MDFIHTYFNTKIGAFGKLLKLIDMACDQELWLDVILLVLWTWFCIIGGLLILPFDVIFCAIMWYKEPMFREVMENFEEEFEEVFGLVEE